MPNRFKLNQVFEPKMAFSPLIHTTWRGGAYQLSTDGDPIGSGNIASLARPGGNVTGMTTLQSGLGEKRLELLKATLSGISRIAAIWKPKSRTSASNFPATEKAARTLGLEFKSLKMQGPDDFDGAFRAATKWRADAVAVLSDAAMYSNRVRFLGLAEKHNLPTMHTHHGWVKAGALISYGDRLIINFIFY